MLSTTSTTFRMGNDLTVQNPEEVTAVPKKKPAAPPTPPARKAGGRPPVYDWSAWRLKYLRGDDAVTLEALSLQTGAPSLTQLKRRSSAEDWPGLRTELRARADTKKLDAAEDLVSIIRDQQFKVTKQMLVLGLRILANADTEKADLRDGIRLLDRAMDAQRKLAGMEEVTVRLEDIRTPADLKKLTTEQLLELRALRARAEA